MFSSLRRNCNSLFDRGRGISSSTYEESLRFKFNLSQVLSFLWWQSRCWCFRSQTTRLRYHVSAIGISLSTWPSVDSRTRHSSPACTVRECRIWLISKRYSDRWGRMGRAYWWYRRPGRERRETARFLVASSNLTCVLSSPRPRSKRKCESDLISRDCCSPGHGKPWATIDARRNNERFSSDGIISADSIEPRRTISYSCQSSAPEIESSLRFADVVSAIEESSYDHIEGVARRRWSNIERWSVEVLSGITCDCRSRSIVSVRSVLENRFVRVRRCIWRI